MIIGYAFSETLFQDNTVMQLDVGGIYMDLHYQKTIEWAFNLLCENCNLLAAGFYWS